MILFSILNKKKIKKRGRGARVDATWHAGPRGSATQDPRSAYVAHIYYYIIITIYIKRGLQPRLEGEGITPLK